MTNPNTYSTECPYCEIFYHSIGISSIRKELADIMAEKRKDNKGRNLLKGEGQRSNGRYYYQYKDTLGHAKVVYDWDLSELRNKEKQIHKDLEDGINGTASKMTLNQLFDLYISLKDSGSLKESTKSNYIGMWNYHLRNSELGNAEIKNIKTSHIMRFYKGLKDKGLSNSTIKFFHTILVPCFNLALDDDMIRKNPVKKDCIKPYKGKAKVKEALTREEQKNLLEFMENSNIYNTYVPMIKYMIGTACRIGEVIGITWNDVDMKNRKIFIDHQLIYKKASDGKTRFMITDPKSESGHREIPMTNDIFEALSMQRKYNLYMGIPRDYMVDGYNRFIFTTKTGKPIAPNGFNNVMKNVVGAYNKQETILAESENRQPVLLPHISAHTFRHTGCTRMAEAGIDIKVLQNIMGHSDISITMDVYNHVNEDRIQNELEKLEGIIAV